jgi:hypothetical protein
MMAANSHATPAPDRASRPHSNAASVTIASTKSAQPRGGSRNSAASTSGATTSAVRIRFRSEDAAIAYRGRRS